MFDLMFPSFHCGPILLWCFQRRIFPVSFGQRLWGDARSSVVEMGDGGVCRREQPSDPCPADRPNPPNRTVLFATVCLLPVHPAVMSPRIRMSRPFLDRWRFWFSDDLEKSRGGGSDHVYFWPYNDPMLYAWRDSFLFLLVCLAVWISGGRVDFDDEIGNTSMKERGVVVLCVVLLTM